MGSVLDPVADKLFMASAFGVVAVSGRLAPAEIVGVLLRDIVAAVAFAATLYSQRPRAIPARAGGKAVTVAQMLTLLAFLVGSPLLQPMAWATTAVAIYAIWDYYRVAPAAERRVGGTDA
jgi:phosphatidylglycerophosphate synthase